MGSASQNRTSAGKAFTLVELLVVVAIIGLLVSILLPSLRGARKQARAIQCSSNLHGHSHGLWIYTQEHDGWIPREMRLPGVVLPFAFALSSMLDYKIDARQNMAPQFLKVPVFQCPAFPTDNHDASGNPLPEQPIDYVANGFPANYQPEPDYDEPLDEPDPKALWRSEGAHDEPPLKLSGIRNPSGMIFLTEGHRHLPTTQPFAFHDVWRGSQLPRGRHPRVATDLRHPGGINVAFFDGHVEPRLPRNIKVTDWYYPG